MKKKILKLICLCLSVFMVFCLSACNGGGGTSSTGEFQGNDGDFNLSTDTSSEGGAPDIDIPVSESTESTEPVVGELTDPDSMSLKELMANIPASLKGTTITVLTWNREKEVTGAEKVIDDFQKLSGIKVDWQVVAYDDYDSKIAAAINAGTSPDIIRYRGPEIHRQYFCQDITAATGYDYSGKIWDSRVSSAYTVKGKVYGVNLKDTLVNQPRVVVYRPSVIKKYKLEDPYTLWKSGKWTYDKMIEMCNIYKDLTSEGTALMPTDHADLLWMTGEDLITFNGNTFTNNIQSTNVFNLLKSMCELRATTITREAMRQSSYFEEGNVLFMIDNSISLRRTNSGLQQSKSDDDVTCVPIPSIKGVDSYWMSELEAYGVPKGAKNGEAVYYFLRYYLDASNYDESTFFADEQTLEVYKWCMEQKNFTYRMSPNLLDAIGQAGGSNAGLADYIRKQGTVANLKSELDSLKPVYDNAVKKANEALAKFN